MKKNPSVLLILDFSSQGTGSNDWCITSFAMKNNIFKSFLTYSLLPDHQKTCMGCSCKLPHSVNFHTLTWTCIAGAALENLLVLLKLPFFPVLNLEPQKFLNSLLAASYSRHRELPSFQINLLPMSSLFGFTHWCLSRCRSTLNRFCVSRLVSQAQSPLRLSFDACVCVCSSW